MSRASGRKSYFMMGMRKTGKKVPVIGSKGVVGSAIARLCKEAGHHVYEVDLDDSDTPTSGSDFLHFCVPFADKTAFFRMVEHYIDRWKPEYFVLHSSVVPGITRYCHENLDSEFAYSPVRGQHDAMFSDLRRYTKYVASFDQNVTREVEDHLRGLGLKVVSLDGPPEWLELAKLLDVAFYGIMIGWAQEAERICRTFGVPHDLVREFGKETERFYSLRPDIRPGFAGGGCVRQDVVLLNQIYESDFFRAFMASNLKKADEMGADDEIDRAEMDRCASEIRKAS